MSIVIYRLSDKVPVKIGGLTFWLSPLSVDQKARLAHLTRRVSGVDEEDTLRYAHLALKLSLKGLDGAQDSSGSEYSLSFDPEGCLTDECASEVLQLDGYDKLIALCRAWAQSGVRTPEAMREDYLGRIKEQYEAGLLSEAQYNGAMSIYQFDGVEVDLSKVQSVKKKSSPQPG